MTLKLKVGKRYVCRDGTVTAPLTRTPKGHGCAKSHPYMDPDDGRTYKPTGVYWDMPDEEGRPPRDLTAEYVDPAAAPKPAKTSPSIAQEAEQIVSGARRSTYGGAEDNFERIARFWNAYFKNTGREVEVTASDVSPMMRLLKEARLCETPTHRDSFVDLIGYAITGARVNKVE